MAIFLLFLSLSLIAHVRDCHPKRVDPQLIDLDEPVLTPGPSQTETVEEQIKLPTLREIRSSHDKLKELCMPCKQWI